MTPVTLRTERLVLSMPTTEDIDAITAAAQDPEVPRWTRVPSPYARTNAEQFIANTAAWWDAETELIWGIHVEGRWVGMIGLHRFERGESAEIGFWLAEPARGRGYLTEAAREVIDFAFEPGGPGLKRLDWRAVVGNVTSAQAARRLGFRYQGLIHTYPSSTRERDDRWIAYLLVTDDRTPQPWPVLEA